MCLFCSRFGTPKARGLASSKLGTRGFSLCTQERAAVAIESTGQPQGRGSAVPNRILLRSPPTWGAHQPTDTFLSRLSVSGSTPSNAHTNFKIMC